MLKNHSSSLNGCHVISCEVFTEDQGQDSHQLDQDVETGSACIFQGISHCVTDHCCCVDFGSLLDGLSFFVLEESCLDIFFGVVPGSTGVGWRNGHLDSADDGTREETEEGFGSEEETKQKWCNCDLNKMKNTSRPGIIISFKDDWVLISTHRR